MGAIRIPEIKKKGGEQRVIQQFPYQPVPDLDGGAGVDDPARIVCYFPGIDRELNEAPDIRENFQPDTDAGRVVPESL